MEIPSQLRCLISAEVEEHDGSFVVEIPDQEITNGTIQNGETYRVALLPGATNGDGDTSDDTSSGNSGPPDPPVEEGETRVVEIDDIGEQGDGITRVERGFVVIVPNTDQGERVEIEITDVQQNVAFADVTERKGHFR